MARAKGPKSGTRGARKRRGKGESNTEARANEVEVRTAAAVGELELPKPDDWNYHKKQIVGYREQVSTANSRVRNAIKAAKKSGIDMDAMNKSIQFERDADPAAAMKHFSQLSMGLKESGSTIQISVHDTLAGDVQKQAYERGLSDAKGNRMASNPYPESSDLAGQYTRGYRHGTADNMGITRSDADKAAAEEEETAGTPMPEGAHVGADAPATATH